MIFTHDDVFDKICGYDSLSPHFLVSKNIVNLCDRTTDLGQGEDDEEVDREALARLEVLEGDRGAVMRSAVVRAAVHVELQPHVPEVQRVDHAAEDGDGDGEPAVDEEAHAALANRQRVEEKRIHKQPHRAH